MLSVVDFQLIAVSHRFLIMKLILPDLEGNRSSLIFLKRSDSISNTVTSDLRKKKSEGNIKMVF